MGRSWNTASSVLCPGLYSFFPFFFFFFSLRDAFLVKQFRSFESWGLISFSFFVLFFSLLILRPWLCILSLSCGSLGRVCYYPSPSIFLFSPPHRHKRIRYSLDRDSLSFSCFRNIFFSGLNLVCWSPLTPTNEFQANDHFRSGLFCVLSGFRSRVYDSKGSRLRCLVLAVYIGIRVLVSSFRDDLQDFVDAFLASISPHITYNHNGEDITACWPCCRRTSTDSGCSGSELCRSVYVVPKCMGWFWERLRKLTYLFLADVFEAASTIAFGLMKYYTGNNTGDVPGNLPDPYFCKPPEKLLPLFSKSPD